jgi:hypothetical protein
MKSRENPLMMNNGLCPGNDLTERMAGHACEPRANAIGWERRTISGRG